MFETQLLEYNSLKCYFSFARVPYKWGKVLTNLGEGDTFPSFSLIYNILYKVGDKVSPTTPN